MAKTVAYHLKYNREYVLKIVGILLVVIFILYCYLLVSSIFNTIERQLIISQIADLHGKMSTLENTYIGSVTMLSLDKALSLGFKNTVKPTYISKNRILLLSALDNSQ